jgi:drug/metabolite transporter (DMT)-like permease
LPLWLHGLLVLSVACAACGQVLFKLGATGARAPADYVNLSVAGGLGFYGVGTVMWIFALSKAPLTSVYPYTALTFVFVYAAGAALFHEQIPVRSMLGIALVLAGLLLINHRAMT